MKVRKTDPLVGQSEEAHCLPCLAKSESALSLLGRY
jgi:hypothetical protein